MPGLEDRIRIANPQQPHCACVLLLDTSLSMSENGKIDQLNEGLRTFHKEVSQNDLARKRVDLAIVTFGEDVRVLQDFAPVEATPRAFLTPGGFTPMGAAVQKAVAMIEQRKQHYRDSGVDHYRPWIFMLTDGDPTDMNPGTALWNQVTQALDEGENQKKFLFWAVAVEPGNTDLLRQLASNKPQRLLKLRPGCFKELFIWLSNSMARVSASRVGEQVTVEDPSSWLTFDA
jgi:uncharacterized protein YegL